MLYDVVITAAGSGSRMQLNENKILKKINGVPCLLYSVNLFRSDSECQKIIITLQEQEIPLVTSMLDEYSIDKENIFLVKGGPTRQRSVYEGLKKANRYDVMIHDGARPFVTMEEITLLKEKLNFDRGVILARPVTDTLKKVAETDEIVQTMNREEFYLAQTPQAFRTDAILRAHEMAIDEEYIGTDDASLIEHAELFNVLVVEGKPTNIKITYQDDLLYAEFLAKKMEEEMDV